MIMAAVKEARHCSNSEAKQFMTGKQFEFYPLTNLITLIDFDPNFMITAEDEYYCHVTRESCKQDLIKAGYHETEAGVILIESCTDES